MANDSYIKCTVKFTIECRQYSLNIRAGHSRQFSRPRDNVQKTTPLLIVAFFQYTVQYAVVTVLTLHTYSLIRFVVLLLLQCYKTVACPLPSVSKLNLYCVRCTVYRPFLATYFSVYNVHFMCCIAYVRSCKYM